MKASKQSEQWSGGYLGGITWHVPHHTVDRLMFGRRDKSILLLLWASQSALRPSPTVPFWWWWHDSAHTVSCTAFLSTCVSHLMSCFFCTFLQQTTSGESCKKAAHSQNTCHYHCYYCHASKLQAFWAENPQVHGIRKSYRVEIRLWAGNRWPRRAR